MILRAFKTAFENAKKKNFDKLYVAIDIHDTMLTANFDSERSIESLPTDWLPGAKEVMRMMSDRPDLYLILNTCSYPKEIARYIEFFINEGIKFDSIGSNPDVQFTRNGWFKEKMYVNIYMDDKAGFHYTDFPDIKEFLIKEPILKQK